MLIGSCVLLVYTIISEQKLSFRIKFQRNAIQYISHIPYNYPRHTFLELLIDMCCGRPVRHKGAIDVGLYCFARYFDPKASNMAPRCRLRPFFAPIPTSFTYISLRASYHNIDLSYLHSLSSVLFLRTTAFLLSRILRDHQLSYCMNVYFPLSPSHLYNQPNQAIPHGCECLAHVYTCSSRISLYTTLCNILIAFPAVSHIQDRDPIASHIRRMNDDASLFISESSKIRI